MKAENTIRDGKTRVLLAGDAWRVRGTVKPFVAGQTIRVRFSRGGKRRQDQRRQAPARPNGTGTFLVGFKAAQGGRPLRGNRHPQGDAAAGAAPQPRRTRAGAPARHRRPAQRGAIVRLLQRGLKRLHYAVPRSGVYDDATQRAVMAWRKVTGVLRTTSASRW